MDTFRQDIIEALIFGGKVSAYDLADILQADPYEVFDALERMRAENIATVANWESLSDDGDEYEGEYVRRARRRGVEPKHFVHWSYCGGPISRAFAEAA